MPLRTSTPGSEIKGADLDANFAICVLTEGDQTIAGKKTFSTPVAVSTPIDSADATTKIYVDNVFQISSTPTRIKDKEYQNTTGKTMIVLVTMACSSAVTGASRWAGAVGKIGVSTPTTAISRVRISATADSQNCSGSMVITMFVPNNYYYKIVSEASDGTLNGSSVDAWIETTT